MAKPIEVGDQVQYRAAFLRSICVYTGSLPFAKGDVTEVRDLGGVSIAVVDWGLSSEDVPARVNVNNLKRVSDWEPN